VHVDPPYFEADNLANGGFALWGKTIRIGNLKQGDSATPALVLGRGGSLVRNGSGHR
jgi:hypothetical protein